VITKIFVQIDYVDKRDDIPRVHIARLAEASLLVFSVSADFAEKFVNSPSRQIKTLNKIKKFHTNSKKFEKIQR
jgi:hypothetical protein